MTTSPPRRSAPLFPLIAAFLSISGCRSGDATPSVAHVGDIAPSRDGIAEPVSATLTAELLAPSIQPFGPEDAVPTSVVIELGRAVVDKDAPERRLGGTRVRLEPEHSGTVVFTSPSTLTYTPSQPFAYATHYSVTLEAVQTSAGVLRQPLGARWSSAFKTPEFQLARITPQNIDYGRSQVALRIAFTGPVIAAHIAKFLAFQIDGQSADVSQIKQAAPNVVTASLSTARIRPLARLAVDVRAGVQDAAGRSTAGPATASVILPGGQPVQLLDARLREGAEGFYVEIVCNDHAAGNPRYHWDPGTQQEYSISRRCRITDEDAQRFIRFTPKIDFRVGPAAVGFRVLGDFKRGPYSMTIAAGATTVDGGVVLQTFQREFAVSARAPKLQFSSSGRYLPRSAWKNLAVQHINVQEAELIVRQIPPENLVFWLSQEQQETADARTSDVILRKKISLRGTPDERSTLWLDLASMVPDTTRGVLEIALRAGNAVASSRLILTDMSLVAKRSTSSAKEPWRHEVRVWALGVQSTEPLSGVLLALKRRSGKTVAECITDSQGTCVLAVKHRADEDDSEPFAIIARRRDDLTYMRYADLRAPTSDFAVHGEPYSSERVYRAAAWSDRGVFRPGETAHLAAILRGRDALAPKAGLPVDLKLTDPRGRVSRELHLRTNEAGLLEGELPIPFFADTGQYRAVLSVAQKEVGALTFNVEEFVPERMKVETVVSSQDYAFGDAAKVEVLAKYLFGGSAEGSRVELTCSLEPSAFRPEENASFVFGAQLPEDPSDEAEQKPVSLGRSDALLEPSGKAVLECPELGATGFRGAGRLVASASVFEAGSGRSTQSRATAAVHPERFYIGLKTSTSRAQAQAPLHVEGILVDWKGHVALASPSHIEVETFRLEAEYGYFWDEQEGTERYERNLRAVLEGTRKVAVKNARFAFDVSPAVPSAAYLVRAKSGNARTDLRLEGEVSGEYIWYGAHARVDQTPRPLKPTALVLRTPETVRVGEAVKVGFKAPFRGRVLFTAETDRILDWKWMAVQAGEVTWEFKLDAFVPNVYVSAFLVKDPHFESAESFLPDRAFGVVSATVAPAQFTHELKLSLPKEVRSNGRLEVGIEAERADGPTYAAVAVVDEGVLSLTRFASPNPVPDIFVRRALGIETYETIGWTLLAPPSGNSRRTGGDGTAAPGTGGAGRVQPVKPVALWSGWVKLDGSGKATVPFQLPQYRGSVRVMAVSASAKSMGHASAGVLVKDPLVLQTTLPRFLTQGDVIQIPVFVTNLSGAAQEVRISLTAENLSTPGAASQVGAMSPLQLLGRPEGRVHLDASRSATVVFQAKAVLPTGAAKLVVAAKAGNLASTELLEVPFQPAGPRERIVQSLELGPGRHDLKRYLGGWVPGSEHTSIWLTANPYAESFDHLSHLLRYPYGCIEQTTSSTRPLLFVSELIQRVDPTLTAGGKLEDMVMHGVNRILSMQTPSGGFGYWMGDPNPTAWGTAYATHMLLDAQKAGYAVPKDRVEQVLAWIEQQVARYEGGARGENGDHGWSTGAEPYMHFVLALSGRGQKARVQKLIEERASSGARRGVGAEAEELYMLQAALWLAGDRRYEKELRNPDSSPIASERRNDWSFYSDQRRRGFMLSTFEDLFGNEPAGEPLAGRVAAALRGQPSARYTTQELVWSVTGLGKRVRGFSREFKPGILLANGKSMDPAPGTTGSERTWSVYRASEHRQLELEVKDAGKSGRLVAVVSTEGVRQKANWRTGGEGLRVSRRFRAPNGAEMDLGRPMALAELAFVELEIVNTTRARVQNVALVDRLPAGWEIENPRLGRGSALPWVNSKEIWQADFMNVRDDRIEVFGTLGPGERKKVVYGVRAVTSGVFTLPPVEAEAMYDPSIWAREPGGKVEIQGNWKDLLL